MIENKILSALIDNEDYARKVITFIDKSYFKNNGDKVIFDLIYQHFIKYNNIPTKSSIEVDLSNMDLVSYLFDEAKKSLSELNPDKRDDTNWLIDSTEDWIKRRAFFNAISDSADMIENGKSTDYHQALDKVTKAISVGFDTRLGSDYFNDADKRFDSLKILKDKIPCGISSFDTVTKGGFIKPSLTLFLASTGVGKSLFLCNIAKSYLEQGKNVLYFTMEMAEEQVERRIDLNLLDISNDELNLLDKIQFVNRIESVKKRGCGKLITKEFVARQTHSGHLRQFIEEIKNKRNFIPDIIIVDYLGITASSRLGSKNTSSYDYYSSVAVEIRGIAQEYDLPVFSAHQINRTGSQDGDFDLTAISDSWGVVSHCDYIYGIVETNQLAEMNQMKVKRLKDRYNDYTTWYPSFLIGIDKTKQRIYDINMTNEIKEIQDFTF